MPDRVLVAAPTAVPTSSARLPMSGGVTADHTPSAMRRAVIPEGRSNSCSCEAPVSTVKRVFEAKFWPSCAETSPDLM